MSDKRTEIDADVPCPSCGNKTFEDVGYTWVGSKGITFHRYANGSTYSDFDKVEDETYWDDMQHLFYECLSCDAAYILEKDSNGKFQLVEINAGEVSLKKDVVKYQIKALHEEKKLYQIKIRKLKNEVKELESKSKELEKFIAISSRPAEKSILKGLRKIKKE